MKRIKILLILIVPLLLTGCASTLNCNIKTNNYESNIKIKFQQDKPTTYKYKDAMNFNDMLNIDSELYLNEKQTKYGVLIAEDYASVREFQNTVKTKVTYDFSKDTTQDENALLISKTDSLAKAKEKIEKLGYTCK